METLVSISGVIGAGLCIVAYFLLEREVFSSFSLQYYFMNGLGAFLVLVAAFYSYDNGDAGAIVQEFCWVGISIMGIHKTMRVKK